MRLFWRGEPTIEHIMEPFSTICSRNIVSTTYHYMDMYVVPLNDLPNVDGVVQTARGHLGSVVVDHHACHR